MVLKANILEAKYEDKLEFPGCRGRGEVQNITTSVGGREYIGYFLAICGYFKQGNWKRNWKFYIAVKNVTAQPK